jgi:hypothetical protein
MDRVPPVTGVPEVLAVVFPLLPQAARVTALTARTASAAIPGLRLRSRIAICSSTWGVKETLPPIW